MELLVIVIGGSPVVFLFQGYVLVGVIYIIEGRLIECSFDSQSSVLLHYDWVYIGTHEVGCFFPSVVSAQIREGRCLSL
jgi:hypothetical protein